MPGNRFEVRFFRIKNFDNSRLKLLKKNIEKMQGD
jgi:hypothetical protein